MRRTYDNFCHDTIVLSLNINGCLVSFLKFSVSTIARPKRSDGVLTTSSKTSPAEKDSPSFFFQDAIPPSVIVGLIAGIKNFDKACLRDEEWMPAAERE